MAKSEELGFIIIPFELNEDNGQGLKEIVLQFADLWGLEKEFHTWIRDVMILVKDKDGLFHLIQIYA